MTNTSPSELQQVSQAIAQKIRDKARTGDRRLVAVSGAPASGKSTLAEILAEDLRSEFDKVAVVPMDGFHLDNRLLAARGLLAFKGAPETFDASGFVALVKRIKSGVEVIYPQFDRVRDLAVAGAAVVEADCDLVIFEGNYLLFDEKPWDGLVGLWDLSIWLDTPEPVLLERLVKRWIDHDHSLERARERAERNDMQNARRIRRSRLEADIVLGAVRTM